MKTLGFVLVLVAPAAVYAEPAGSDAGETIVVIDRLPDLDATPAARDRDRALGDAPFVTIIHPDDHDATASVADAVGATVGTQTHSLGGLGAYESVTVRGAPSGDTEVLIDGVPLARIASVTTDLGRFALGDFGQVELYRGSVPVELGGAGVGGALNLVTRLGRDDNGDRITASAGFGSFGARHVRLHYGDSHWHDKLVSSTTVGYQGATGDYTYFSDNGTPLNTKDDRYLTRTNDAFDQVDVASRVGIAGTPTNGGIRVAWKDQGLAGSEAMPTMKASLDTIDVVGDAHGEQLAGGTLARELGFVLVEKQALHDPLGELGLGAQERDYTTLSAGANGTWIVPFSRHRAVIGAELRGDRFTDADANAARPALVGAREGGAALAAVDFVLDPEARIIVTPSFRYDLVRTAPTPSGEPFEPPAVERTDSVPSPRLSMRAAITQDVSIKGSAGWYERLPTLIELFGDRGTIIGTPNLLPERGPSAETGAVWAPSTALGPVDRIMVEGDGFATRSHDTIAFISTVGFAVRAMNIADSLTYGAEAVASARIARIVTLTANYTRLVTEQLVADPELDEKTLPREPGHALYARADAAYVVLHRRTNAWLDASYQSTAYLDQANLQQVPGRVLFGCGARVEIVRKLGVSLSVANLANLRVQELPLVPPPSPTITQAPTALADLYDFPLPGRAFYVSLDWSYR
jgi:iron complex outermembrane receptor protein